jgi:hypothetical protein
VARQSGHSTRQAEQAPPTQYKMACLQRYRHRKNKTSSNSSCTTHLADEHGGTLAVAVSWRVKVACTSRVDVAKPASTALPRNATTATVLHGEDIKQRTPLKMFRCAGSARNAPGNNTSCTAWQAQLQGACGHPAGQGRRRRLAGQTALARAKVLTTQGSRMVEYQSGADAPGLLVGSPRQYLQVFWEQRGCGAPYTVTVKWAGGCADRCGGTPLTDTRSKGKTLTPPPHWAETPRP